MLKHLFLHLRSKFQIQISIQIFIQFSSKWYISFIPGSRIRSLDHAWFNHLLGTDIFVRLHSIRTRSAIIIDDTRNTGAAPTPSSCTVSVIILAPQSGRGGGGGGYWLPLDNAYSSASEIGDLFIEVAASLSRCRARGGGEGGRRGREGACVDPVSHPLRSIGYWWTLILFERETQRRSPGKYLRQEFSNLVSDNSSNS